jgi:phosphatidylserine decarboxylase
VLLGWWWVVGAIAVVWVALVSFFRDPIRSIPRDLPAGAMLSPADGTISAVEHVDWHEITNGPAVVVRIFLSVLNVHVNRSPYDAVVCGVHYTPGKFLNAQTAESARVNENSLMAMEIAGGERIGVRQISGMIARRIVCRVRENDRLARGQKFGMIKFGSTAELILPRPDDVAVHVEKGQRVRGGKTVLATLAPAPNATGTGGDA